MENLFNILHISSARTWRGGEQQLLNLSIGLQKRGVSCHHLVVKGSPLAKKLKELEFPFSSYYKLSGLNPIVGLKIIQYCKKNAIDLIHLHDSHSINYFIYSRKMGNKIPAVAHRKVDFLPQDIWKYRHQGIQHIICVSHAIEKVMLNLDDNLSTKVIHDGVAKYTGTQLDLREHLELPDDSFVVVMVAALADHKDYSTFIKVAEKLVHHHGEKTFHFIAIGGNAGVEVSLKSQVKRSKLENHFHFTGFLNNARGFLSSADIFMLTSKEEGLGSVIIEAMQAEVPVIATDAGGISELVIDKKNGFLGKVGDVNYLVNCVMNIFKNKVNRTELVRNALVTGLQFSLDEMVNKTLHLYEEVLK